MATVSFEAQIKEGEDGKRLVRVPKFTKDMCDMPAFRASVKYGGVANSEIFLNKLGHIRRKMFPKGTITLGEECPGVAVEKSGSMAKVTVRV